MKANINLHVLPIFSKLYSLESGIAILMSGRGTGKSHAVSRLANINVLQKGYKCCILRDEKTKVKETILQDVKQAYDLINDKMNGELNKEFTFTDQGLTNKIKGESQIFTLGFRASSKEDKTKLKGLTGVKLVIIDEAEDVRDKSKVDTLLDTVIRNNALVVIILNTPDKDHWLIKKYFDLYPSEYEGYYIPKPKDIENVHYFLPTYKDNTKLNIEAVKLYQSYGDPESENYNLDHYLSSIMGYVSEGRKGRIYNDWKRISIKDYESLEYTPKYGLDFGFTNDPTALVEIKEHNDILYLRQKIYKHRLTNDMIANLIKSYNINQQIVADSSEPKSIEEIKKMGIDIVGANKTKGSVNAGIDTIQNKREVYVCDDSEDIWNEYLNYVWQLDKNKKPTNDPEDANNHAMDAIRYGIEGVELYFDLL